VLATVPTTLEELDALRRRTATLSISSSGHERRPLMRQNFGWGAADEDVALAIGLGAAATLPSSATASRSRLPATPGGTWEGTLTRSWSAQAAAPPPAALAGSVEEQRPDEDDACSRGAASYQISSVSMQRMARSSASLLTRGAYSSTHSTVGGGPSFWTSSTGVGVTCDTATLTPTGSTLRGRGHSRSAAGSLLMRHPLPLSPPRSLDSLNSGASQSRTSILGSASLHAGTMATHTPAKTDVHTGTYGVSGGRPRGGTPNAAPPSTSCHYPKGFWIEHELRVVKPLHEEHVALSRRPHTEPFVYPLKRLRGYSGPRWEEPLPEVSDDRHQEPLWVVSAPLSRPSYLDSIRNC